MKLRIASSIALGCCMAVLAGCHEETGGAFEPEQLDVPLEPAAALREEPPAGANGLLPSCFWAHGAQQALRALGGAALHQGGGSLPVVPLALIPLNCRQVLAYTVACALPQGQTLLDPVTGSPLAGWWGLAPGWRNAALDTEGRRYVTGCLIQRLNATGTPVPIALEGPHPAIEHDPDLAAIYSIRETTVLGDLFSSQTPLTGLLPAFNVYGCWEDVLPQSCGVLGLPLLGERICDDLVLCGFVSLGPCSLSCAPNGPYHQCKPGLLSPWWTETVRVRLDPQTCE